MILEGSRSIMMFCETYAFRYLGFVGNFVRDLSVILRLDYKWCVMEFLADWNVLNGLKCYKWIEMSWVGLLQDLNYNYRYVIDRVLHYFDY